MPRLLHILTRPVDVLPREIIRAQQASPEATVEIVELAETSTAPDYEALLEKIFAADSVAVW